MSWFDGLTGIRETSPVQVRENLALQGQMLTSKVNGKSFHHGRLEIRSLAALRSQIDSLRSSRRQIRLREVISDSQSLHTDVTNAGALFQVASQFNLLEMMGPYVTPEHGIGIYENDFTQGPACAIACGAGTIYRNYFAPVNGQNGQTELHQIDCLDGIGQILGNHDEQLWQMSNGYALATESGLQQISDRLLSSSETDRDEIRKQLQIGIHWDTQVTLHNSQHHVTQAFCSALPVAYSSVNSELWEPFARLILEASYEATFCAAVLNARTTGQNRLYLTLLGGGAFGNDIAWIVEAIHRSAELYAWADLDVAIVSFCNSNPHVQRLAGQPSRI